MNEVIVERPSAHVAVIRLNRPEARNALNQAVRSGLAEQFAALGADAGVRVIVLTGGDRIFAAGADLRDLADRSAIEILLRQSHRLWQAIAACPKPVIAAVNGLAWGGGCELAMHADLIVAGEGASFCQPEVKVGVMPGAGGTQRLTRAVGKAKAMDLCLTGRMMDAAEAEKSGLVARVIPADELLAETLKAAQSIAGYSLPVVMMIKESVNRAFESSLNEGLLFERRAFHSSFALEDQKEGMAAFTEKRKPTFKNR